MTVSGQFSCPPPGSFVAVSGQFLVAADTDPGRLGAPGGPSDVDGLRRRAAAAMTVVASRARVTTPAVDVVEVLGAPLASRGGPVTGDGGLAVTRFQCGRPPTVVFAAAALTGLSPAALHSLAAHDLLTAPTGPS